MPQVYRLKVDNHVCLSSSEENKCIVALADVKGFPDLPLTPNVREPNSKSSVYRQILDSLFVAPEKFGDKHSGITISVDSVKVISDHELELTIFGPNKGCNHHGILNGGHTVLAFKHAAQLKYKLDQAHVKVIIYSGLTEEACKDIGLATNTNSPVDMRSRMNAKGRYDFIKKYLQELELESDKKFRISYYQNQSDAPSSTHCSINHVIKLLVCLDCNRYNPDAKTRRHPTISSLPREIKDSDQERISKLLHLFPQALWIEIKLYEIIHQYLIHPQRKGVDSNPLASIDIRKNTLLCDSEYSFGFGAPADLSLPIVAAFRVFLDSEYNWVLPFDEFCEDLIKHLWRTHLLDYLKKEKIAGNSIGARISRNNELWENLYTCASMYQNKLYRNMISQKNSNKSKNKGRKLILK